MAAPTSRAQVSTPAQRVMDCGDAGHILLSKRVAEDLEQFKHWRPHLYHLGECEVKHGEKIEIVNLFTAELGNSERPKRLMTSDQKIEAVPLPPSASSIAETGADHFSMCGNRSVDGRLDRVLEGRGGPL